MTTSQQMPLYQGTKTLYATPMTRGDYNAYRGWQVPTDEDPADAGYLVEYTDGGKPNDPRHAGYISWSPVDVFQAAYKPCGTFIERMELERDQLSDRIGKLTFFAIDQNPAFASLPPVQRNMLIAQRDAMQTYLTILLSRISLAKDCQLST